MENKICSTCHRSLPTSEFYAQKGHRGGVMSMCKECFNRYCIERWRARKIRYIQYLGGQCEQCGIKLTENNYSIFDFHHRNPAEKEMAWNKTRLMSEQKVMQELDKCALLCANCHRIIHQNDSLA